MEFIWYEMDNFLLIVVFLFLLLFMAFVVDTNVNFKPQN